MAQDASDPALRRFLATLGGRAAMDRLPRTRLALHGAIAKGLRPAALSALVRHGVLRRSELTMLMPARTLARRKKGARLTPEESDRLARTTRVVLRAREVFGDPAKADAWLRRPNRALAGAMPLMLTRHDEGARLVESALNRIAYGDHT